YALVVQDLGERKFAGDICVSFLRLGICAEIEERETAVVARFQRLRIVGTRSCERCSRIFVLLRVEIFAPEGHPTGAEVWAQFDGFFEMPFALLLVSLGDSTDVLLEGIESQTCACGKECLLCDA